MIDFPRRPIDVPEGVLEMGPYKTRKEADEEGVERTLTNEHKPGYITADKRRLPKSRLAGWPTSQ